MLTLFKRFLKEDDAVAAIEAGLLFPLLVMILCGSIDMGTAVLANQKAINSSEMVSDLLTRNPSVSAADVSNAIVAGQLAFMPLNSSSYGVDVVGIQYIGTGLTPTVKWRTTQNMVANAGVVAASAGLGAQNEGVVAVTVQYIFNPIFTSYMIGPVTMTEVSFARGRTGTFVIYTG